MDFPEPLKNCKNYLHCVEVILEMSRIVWEIVISHPGKKDLSHKENEYHEKPFFSFPIELAVIKETLKKNENGELLYDLFQYLLEYKYEENKILLKEVRKAPGFIMIVSSFFSPIDLTSFILDGVRSEADMTYFIVKAIRNYYGCPLSEKSRYYFTLIIDLVNSYIITSARKIISGNEGAISENENPFLKGKKNIQYSSLFRECFDLIYNLYIQTQERHSKNLSNDESSILKKQVDSFIKCFFEVSRAIGYFSNSINMGYLFFRTDEIDIEYFISYLYGLPLDITGLNELFGGNGPILPESLSSTELEKAENQKVCDHEEKRFQKNFSTHLFSNQLKARSLVIAGEIGCGKSILALQLAANVSRKSGVVWYIALEQLKEEVLYTLQSFGIYDTNKFMSIGTSFHENLKLLCEKPVDKGVLFICRSDNKSKPFRELLSDVKREVCNADKDLLKLCIIDPVNSLSVAEEDKVEIRQETLEMIKDLKDKNTNVLMILEESGSEENVNNQNNRWSELLIGKNITDTIIRLSIRDRGSYAQRYLAITKSRMQREQRGEHAFSINPNIGIQVYPSPISVLSRIRNRKRITKTAAASFGHPGIDEILEPYDKSKAIYKGDIVVFHGAGGSFKTHLGLHFLRVVESRKGKKPKTLLFAARDSKETMNHLFSEIEFPEILKMRQVDNDNIEILTFPKAQVNPGRILQSIEKEIKKTRLDGYDVDRVMIDDINQWEMSKDELTDDRNFGMALVELLRSLNVTGLLILNDMDNPNSVFKQTIIENTDCCFYFERYEFRGSKRVTFRVQKSRGMGQRSEPFEIRMDGNVLEVFPSSSLLRFNARDGSVTEVKIRLFFHNETVFQAKHSTSVIEAVKTVLSEQVVPDSQDRLYLDRAIRIGRYSAVDELQILQINEYQLALHSTGQDSNNLPLYQFPGYQWDHGFWDDISDSLLPEHAIKRQDKNSGIQSFCAIPYYNNFSLLAFNRKKLIENNIITENETLSCWVDLGNLCRNWEIYKKKEDSSFFEAKGKYFNATVFFDFPKKSNGNFNSLFFEILRSQFFNHSISDSILDEEGDCIIRKLFISDYAVNAGYIFWQLCRRPYWLDNRYNFHGAPDKKSDENILHVSLKAFVWRHWYTTLNQMYFDFSCEEKTIPEIQVSPLPKGISTSGEWFLGIPSYSAAPEAALEIFKLMTSREAELERVRMGVGLPVRNSFYEVYKERGEEAQCNISPHFSMKSEDLSTILKNKFKRSDIGCYFQVAGTIAYHLKKILEIPIPILKQEDIDKLNQSKPEFSVPDMKPKTVSVENFQRIQAEKIYVYPEIKRIFEGLVQRIEYIQNNNVQNSANKKRKNRKACQLCEKNVENFSGNYGSKEKRSDSFGI